LRRILLNSGETPLNSVTTLICTHSIKVLQDAKGVIIDNMLITQSYPTETRRASARGTH
jgi:hypothetical protein